MSATLLVKEPTPIESKEATAPEAVATPTSRGKAQTRLQPTTKPPSPAGPASGPPPSTQSPARPRPRRRAPIKLFPPTGLPQPVAPTEAETNTQSPKPAPSATEEPARTYTQAQGFAEMVKRANMGNKACLAGVRRVLDKQPEIWMHTGDVSVLAERAWADRIADGNVLIEESVLRSVQALKASLAGPNPSPVESAVIDLVGVAWLASLQSERAAAAQPEGGSVQQAMCRAQRAESAGRRFNSAVRTLALVRRLLPVEVVPLEAKESTGPATEVVSAQA